MDKDKVVIKGRVVSGRARCWERAGWCGERQGGGKGQDGLGKDKVLIKGRVVWGKTRYWERTGWCGKNTMLGKGRVVRGKTRR